MVPLHSCDSNYFYFQLHNSASTAAPSVPGDLLSADQPSDQSAADSTSRVLHAAQQRAGAGESSAERGSAEVAEDLHAFVEGQGPHHQVEHVPSPSTRVHQRDDHETVQRGNPQHRPQVRVDAVSSKRKFSFTKFLNLKLILQNRNQLRDGEAEAGTETERRLHVPREAKHRLVSLNYYRIYFPSKFYDL